MKKILCVLLMVVSVLSGCAKTIPPPNQADVDIAKEQALAAKACYEAQKDTRPDMSSWTAEQIAVYELTQKLADSNLLLAGKSLDRCAEAGGTNYYDARIAEATEDRKRIESWHKIIESTLTKGLFAWGIHEVAGALKNSGTTYNLSGEDNSMTVSDVGNTDINTNIGDQLNTDPGTDVTADDWSTDSADLIPTIQ